MPSLADTTAEILLRHPHEAGRPLSDSPLAALIREEWRAAGAEAAASHHRVRASAGRGRAWAQVPWLAWFDELITTSAQRGFYVVLLLSPERATATLSLAIGSEAVTRAFGEARGRAVLRRRAADVRDRLPDHAARFDAGPIDLGGTSTLPRGYEASHCFGRTYALPDLSDAALHADLHALLAAYADLIARGGLLPPELVADPRAALAERVESAPHVRRMAFTAHGHACAACGLDGRLAYAGTADPVTEVHLLTPTARPGTEDVAILCPTCHAAIHAQDDPADMAALRRRLRFVVGTPG
ncbi:DUF3578 domain-containing protein [Jannaschia sp. Os4]|uniref:MrcB family domain-containing protein n=1 Tax=Jannaschia sp. Os4 TaxID=2807617 RepID=UPI00193A3A0B|nr:DUF3578 domain-containing protein [Jannaschia sp. Os4]MBM2575401.1 DUF3578 domain-containing protein [Jannaschia sp. Os4]